MKRIVLFFMMVILTGIISAQDRSELSDKALSALYKQEIAVLNSEIKTVKVKLKADKENGGLKGDLAVKQEQLKELKSKKKVIDNAIKSKEASEKAAKKAEKAQKKAEKHAVEAQKMKK